MKRFLLLTVAVLLIALASVAGLAQARELEPGDDHRAAQHVQPAPLPVDDLKFDDKSGAGKDLIGPPVQILPTLDDRGAQGEIEPGDDKGGQGEIEPGDDKGGQSEIEPGDDKGGQGEVEPFDDRGGHPVGIEPLPGDDNSTAAGSSSGTTLDDSSSKDFIGPPVQITPIPFDDKGGKTQLSDDKGGKTQSVDDKGGLSGKS